MNRETVRVRQREMIDSDACAEIKIKCKRSARQPTVFFRALCLSAIAGFLFYLGWNAYWIFLGEVPPSIFHALTGLPCPTTGGTRSLVCLLNGEFMESLRYNAMTLPLIGLTGATFAASLRNWFQTRSLVIGRHWLMLWGVTLTLAWVLKLVGDPGYW